MGLFKNLFGTGESTENKTIENKETKPGYTHEELDDLVNYIKGNYIKDCYPIKLTQAEELKLTDSKLGGYPYWDINKEYPVASDGTPLILLAQINFAQAELNDDLLPDEGLLQFFISEGDVYGMNFDDNTLQDTFRVVYHERIDDGMTLENVQAWGVKSNGNLDHGEALFPFFGQYKMEFDWSTDTINASCQDFDHILKDALLDVYGVVTEKTMWRYFSRDEYDYLAEQFGNGGHRMMGYPYFTQTDPRDNPDGEFNVLLLQIDSEGSDILWGDGGIANFFINEEKLKERDFSRVIYNWDCY